LLFAPTEQEQMPERCAPFAVVLKGHPCTGKSSFAKKLCKRLRCPLIDKDDIKGVFEMQREKLNKQVSDAANTLSLDVMWSLLAKQLSLGLHCVLDTTLSRPSHLLRARRVSTAHAAKVLVVECFVSDQAVWKERLGKRVSEERKEKEEEDTRNGSEGVSEGVGGAPSLRLTSDCHKPQSWSELRDLISSYGGSSSYDPLEHGADYSLPFDACGSEKQQRDALDKIVRVVTQEE
jgi:adenylate kinase family enzyme